MKISSLFVSLLSLTIFMKSDNRGANERRTAWLEEFGCFSIEATVAARCSGRSMSRIMSRSSEIGPVETSRNRRDSLTVTGCDWFATCMIFTVKKNENTSFIDQSATHNRLLATRALETTSNTKYFEHIQLCYHRATVTNPSMGYSAERSWWELRIEPNFLRPGPVR